MPEYLAPGVYVEEIERGPKPIEGSLPARPRSSARPASPSRPRLVTSYGEYLRYFGGIFADAAYMPYAVQAFFDNGGRRAASPASAAPGAGGWAEGVARFSLRATGVGRPTTACGSASTRDHQGCRQQPVGSACGLVLGQPQRCP